MVPRANWKGFLKLGDFVCSVALYSATTTSSRVAFHMLNRATGNRLRREFIDSETGETVDRTHQVKGYEIENDRFVTLSAEEMAAALPDNDKTIDITAFIPCAQIDNLYLDRPYYLSPIDRHADEAFELLRDGMKSEGVAAIAKAFLFRRVRSLLIRPSGAGLTATMLQFDYEVRSEKEAFSAIAEKTIPAEMLELAEHIIDRKSGRFDPAAFDDRYDAALAEVVKAKMEGRKIISRIPVAERNVVDLLSALRESVGPQETKSKASKVRGAKALPERRRKAG